MIKNVHLFLHNNSPMLRGLLTVAIVAMLSYFMWSQSVEWTAQREARESSQEERAEATRQIVQRVDDKTQEINETTEKQTVLICSLNRIAGDADEITDKQRREIEEVCEEEIDRFQQRNSRPDSSDESSGNVVQRVFGILGL